MIWFEWACKEVVSEWVFDTWSILYLHNSYAKLARQNTSPVIWFVKFSRSGMRLCLFFFKQIPTVLILTKVILQTQLGE